MWSPVSPHQPCFIIFSSRKLYIRGIFISTKYVCRTDTSSAIRGTLVSGSHWYCKGILEISYVELEQVRNIRTGPGLWLTNNEAGQGLDRFRTWFFITMDWQEFPIPRSQIIMNRSFLYYFSCTSVYSCIYLWNWAILGRKHCICTIWTKCLLQFVSSGSRCT